MKKEDALALLNSIENALRRLRIEIQKLKTDNIYKKTVKDLAQQIGTKWFEELDSSLPSLGVADELRKKYNDLFTSLLSLSLKTSVAQTYLKTIDAILQYFKEELFVTIMKSAGQVVSVTQLVKILENATDEEKDYLDEAVGCANRGFLKASIVLGWCAAVHRMHKTVEKLGFDEFNKKAEDVYNIDKGRFKRFKKKLVANSISDLRATVFDNDLLWVLEYWQLVDANQHERLSICFTMRNNSAHPGEAPITEENLASFCSDLKTIVFDNPKFKL
jgi:hypothetical protein